MKPSMRIQAEPARVTTARARWILAGCLAVVAALTSAFAPAGAAVREYEDAEAGPRTVAGATRTGVAPSAARASGLTPLSSTVVTPNDTFVVASHGFQDLAGACQPRDWAGEDLVPLIFAHVSDRFVVNDGFLTMGTRALWVGADSSSAPDEVAHWVIPYGYGNGWSQRLTSPSFSRVAHPNAVFTFDAWLELRAFQTTSFGSLVSGKTGNDFLGAQGLRADGTWTFLRSRFSAEGGESSWVRTPPIIVTRWGILGSVAGRYNGPLGVAVDDSGNVYVADTNNNRIQKHSRYGTFVMQWGSAGSGPGQFQGPRGIAVDDSGNVFVADADNHRIQKFTRTGTYLTAWGSLGVGTGQFNQPRGVAVDGAGNVYVTDGNNHRVQKFDGAGGFLLAWGSAGSLAGQFNAPAGIAVTPTGLVYVADSNNHRIQRFDGNGAYLGGWGSLGAADGQFDLATSVAVDWAGNVYAGDLNNHRIQKFTAGGTFLTKWGTIGTGESQFNGDMGLAAGPEGDVYVADAANNRIQLFTSGGPLAGRGKVRFEVYLGEDGNPSLGLAEPLQVRIVVQTNARISSEDGKILAADPGVIVVDNAAVRDSLVDVVPAVDFEDGTTGSWTVGAINGSYRSNADVASVIRDVPPPATAPELRTNMDPTNPSCAWTFFSPGDTLANGTFARITSPWFALTPGDSQYVISAASRLNVRAQSRFLRIYTRGKDAGDARPRIHNHVAFIYFGGLGNDESMVPFSTDDLINFPLDFIAPVIATDSVQIVFEIIDQGERDPGGLDNRPTTHLPFIDDVQLKQIGVDADFDGVADAYDDCPAECAAGEDANGDGCVDATATMHHVESWPMGTLRYRLSQNGMPGVTDGTDFSAVHNGIAAWVAVPTCSLTVVADSPTPQKIASPLDGINLITFEDPDFQFSPAVLGVTPTLSFTRRMPYGDRMVLPGQIVDADIIFNPGSSFATSTHAGAFDLQSVATHEFGHFLGLSHSGVRDATMYFVQQPAQDASSLDADDRAALSAAYPGAALRVALGSLQGVVSRDTTGSPVRGALVTAVRINVDGAPQDTVGSDYTHEDGSYTIYGLPPDRYGVEIAPLDGTILDGMTAAYVSTRLAMIVQTDFPSEWWSSSESPYDDPAQRTHIMLGAGEHRTGVNITTNVDTIPPRVVAVNPPDGAEGVPSDASIQVNFSEAVGADSLRVAFGVRPGGVPPRIGGSGLLVNNGQSFVFSPELPLAFGTTYEIRVSTRLQGIDGNHPPADFVSFFSTQTEQALALAGVQPHAAPHGGFVTLSGTGFDDRTVVVFGATGAPVDTAPPAFFTPTTLVAAVPPGVAVGLDSVWAVKYSAGPTQESNRLAVEVLPAAAQTSPVPSGAPIAAGLRPRDVALSPSGLMVYAVGDGGFATINLDPALAAQYPVRTAQSRFTADARAIALAPDGSIACITRPALGDVAIVEANPGSGTFGSLRATIPMPGTPDGIAVSPTGRRAYATHVSTGTVYEMDVNPSSLAPNTLIRQYAVPGATLTGGVTVDPRADRLYLTSSLGALVLLLADGSVTVANSMPGSGGVAIDPAATQLYYSALESGLGAGAASSPFAPGSISFSGSVADVAIVPQGHLALVANKSLNRLQVVDIVPTDLAFRTPVADAASGATPLAVAVDGGGSLVAVANYADQTVSLYQLSGSGAPGVRRVLPDVASPGDQVAVQAGAPTDFVPGSSVDLGFTLFAPSVALGAAAAFVVPPSAQSATTLTMVRPDGVRSLALPFRIVDRIESFAPETTNVSLPVPGTQPCVVDPSYILGTPTLMRMTPDGRTLAVGAERPGSCSGLFLDLYQAADDGAAPLGSHLGLFADQVTGTLLSGSGEQIDDMAFTPDGKRLWVASSELGIREVDTDLASPSLGSVTATFGAVELGNPRAVLADPLGRFMICGSSGTGTAGLSTWDIATRTFIAENADLGAFSLAASQDGTYLVAGGRGIAHIVNLATLGAIASPVPPTGASPDSFYYSVAVTADGKRAVGLYGRMIGGVDATRIAVWNLDPGAGPVGAQLYFGTPPGGFPNAVFDHLIPAPDGNGLIAACPLAGMLVKIEPTVIPPTFTYFPIGFSTPTLARSTDGRRLWTAQPIPGIAPTDWRVKTLALSDAATLALVAGGGQTAPGGTLLPLPVRVRVTGTDGRPQAGIGIDFELPGTEAGELGNPPALSARRLTDANGETEMSWTLPATGTGVSMLVSAPGTGVAPLTVNATVALGDSLIDPVVIELGPADGATGLNANTPVFARFNQKMPPAVTANLALFENSEPVAGAFTLEQDGRLLLFQPGLALPFAARCSLVVMPGVQDLEGQVLAAGATSIFTIGPPPPVEIHSIAPPAGPKGASVVIDGQGFSAIPAQDLVLFNGTAATVLSATPNSLLLNVPVGATSGDVTVRVGGSTSDPVAFNVLAPDATVGEVAGSISASPGIRDIAITPDGSRAYVTNPSTNSVTVLDIRAATTITSITVGLKPQSVAILADPLRAYVANTGSNDVSVIDANPNSASYNKVVNTIPVDAAPVDVAIGAIGPKVYVLSNEAGTLSAIDANSGNATFDKVVTSTNCGAGGQAVAISADGTTAYVAAAAGLVVVDLLGDRVVTTTNTGAGGQAVAISADGTLVLVLTVDGHLFVIDTSAGPKQYQVVTSTNTGAGGQGVAISADGTLAYVTSGDGNKLFVFQIVVGSAGAPITLAPGPPVTLTLIATLPLGQSPAGIAVDPQGGNRVLVVNSGSGTVSIVGTPEALPPVEVAFDFDPGTLNLRSLGKWVKGEIRPPAPFTVAQFDLPSIRLNSTVPVDLTARHDDDDHEDGDHESGHENELEVKFSRVAVQLILPVGDHVPVTVTGRLGPRDFVGRDTIRVVRGKVRKPHHGDVVRMNGPCDVEWEVPEHGPTQWVAVLHSFDRGESWLLDGTHLPNSGHFAWAVPDTFADSVRVAVVLVESADSTGTLVRGVLGVSDPFSIYGTTSVDGRRAPSVLSFTPFRPNPSHGGARMQFGLPQRTTVRVDIYDVQGRRVRTLANGEFAPGWHDLEWHGEAEGHGRAAAGLYFVRFQAAGREFKQRLVWLR